MSEFGSWQFARATAADAPAVAAFQTMVWDQTYSGLIAEEMLAATSTDRTSRWTERISTGERDVTLARIGSEIVGVASTSKGTPPHYGLPSTELCSFSLRTDVRGTGLADQLLREAIGREDAHLLVFEVNERARRFYRRHGFVAFGDPQLDEGTGLMERRMVRSHFGASEFST
ncbi:GNAT family N-acetyltransferase [Microbacterium sp. KSW2-21]|uniref:GNAT family N-acetyltransferase n=1 Tax=Microbacterium algihabitans TaxID=3075992 RepID=A0ABU3RTT2_9MICO|nr:GNAT family N-acetyltransferase [Microbacterium sp. KSW2-21]MDU0325985.1 GNAT family N-acetyltransferase [Microbacterium sp. KSW2-21]